jgi:hypothetical protein
MHATIRLRTTVLAVAVIAAIMAPATTVQADHLSAPVTGFLDDGSTFDGTLRVNRFRSTRLGVVVSGLLVGTVINDEGEVTDVLSNRVTVPVADMVEIGGDCDILLFAMDPINLNLRDSDLHTDPFDLELRAESVNLGSQLCTIADGFETGRFAQIVSALNNILDVLDDR